MDIENDRTQEINMSQQLNSAIIQLDQEQQPQQTEQNQQGIQIEQNQQNVGISQEELMVKRRGEFLRELRNLKLTIIDSEIKLMLRYLGQPICYFGENSTNRRDRLKQLLQSYFMDHGRMPDLSKFQGGKTNTQQQNQEDEENTHFFYPGDFKLKQIREEIAISSLKKAAMRIEKQKLFKVQYDIIQEEEIYLEQCNLARDYDISMSQFGDPSAIMRGQFSKDNEYYVTAGGSGEGKVWSIPDCHQRAVLGGHLTKLHDCQFSPLYNTSGLTPTSYGNIATASSDQTIKLWTLDWSETPIQNSVELKGHEDRINRIKFSLDGKFLFSTSHDTTWRLWDLETKRDILVQTGHKTPVYGTALHSDGGILYTGDFGGTGAIWDLRTGKNILQLTGHTGNILCADWSQNGYQLITGGADNTIRIWDIRRKNCQQVIPAHVKLISDLKYDPTNSYFFVSTSYDGKMKIWNSKDFSLVTIYTAFDSKLTSVDISQGRNFITTTSQDRKWMLWKKKEI